MFLPMNIQRLKIALDHSCIESKHVEERASNRVGVGDPCAAGHVALDPRRSDDEARPANERLRQGSRFRV